jgi:hypothetical protein
MLLKLKGECEVWLLFVYMNHVILDMMIFKPSIKFQPPFEPLRNMN